MAVGVTILLSLAVFFLMVEEKMPVAENLPLIGKYYCCTIIEVSMALAAMCHVLRFVHNRPYALPDWVEVSRNEHAPTLLIVYLGTTPAAVKVDAPKILHGVNVILVKNTMIQE